MTVLYDIEDAVLTEFKANWSYTEIAWDNDDFERLLSGNNSFVAIMVNAEEYNTTTLGATEHAVPGNVTVNVYSTLRNGTSERTTLIQNVINIFQGRKIGGINFDDAVPTTFGRVDDFDETEVVVNMRRNASDTQDLGIAVGTDTLLSDVEDSLFSYLQANWTQTPIDFQNDDMSEGSEEFIRASISPLEETIITSGRAGNRLYRYEGFLFIQIFTELRDGTKRSIDLADAIISLFEDNVINEVRIGDIQNRKSGSSDAYYQRNITITFSADTIK